MSAKVWVPESGLPRLEGMSENVEIEVFDAGGAAGAAGVGMVVPHWKWSRGWVGALRQMPDLKVVQVPSAGVDWILPHVPPGVTLCNGSGIHDATVSEWIVGAILAMQKSFPHFRDLQNEGTWDQRPVEELAGKNVLIVGHGSIGRAVEDRLKPFGVEIVRVARHAREGVHEIPDLPDLLPDADVVVLLVPLTAETQNLFDKRMLARMRENALLVNAARGRVVETDALVEALSAGRIRAALDTTEPEPLPQGHPLWGCPGVLITPHTAGFTSGFPERAWRFVRGQIERYAAGESLENVVREGY